MEENINIEEKCQEIQSWIERGELRKALKRTTLLINRTSHIRFYAAKALILQKLNKVHEARDIAESIFETASEDRVANEFLTEFYRNFNNLQKVSLLLDTYFRFYPNEDKGRQLYETFGYLFKFVEQQRHALRMYRTFNKLEYVEWTVMSMILLADIDQRQVRMLEIAELLLTKLKTEEGFEATLSFLRLDIQVFKRLGKYDEGIALCLEKADTFNDQIEKFHNMAEFYDMKGEFFTAWNFYHQILIQNLTEPTASETWDIQRQYINSIFQIVEKCTVEGTSLNNDNLLNTNTHQIKVIDSGAKYNLWKEFTGQETIIGILINSLSNIKNQREIITGKRPIVEEVKRHSFLDEMEFKRKLICYGFSQGVEEYRGEQEPGGVMYPVINKYVNKYYELPYMVDDLIPYLHFINTSQLQAFKERMEFLIEKITEISTNRNKCLRCTLSCQKLLRIVGVYSPAHLTHVAQLWEISQQMVQYYVDYLESQYIPRRNESRVPDEFILMTNEILLQHSPQGMSEAEFAEQRYGKLHFEHEKDSFFNMRVFYCIIMLENAYKNSPHNLQLKTALMLHYTKLAAHNAVERLNLDMKLRGEGLERHSYIYFSYLSDWKLHLPDLENLCNQILQFHREHFLHIMPNIKQAFDEQNIEQVKQIYKDVQNIGKSYYKFLCQFQITYLQFYKSITVPGQQFARVLREKLPNLKKVLSISTIEEFVNTADLDAIYACGEIQLKKPQMSLQRNQYNPEMLTIDPFDFRTKAKPVFCYGKYSRIQHVRLDAICMKLLLDISERNGDIVDADLKELNRILMQLHYLDKPNLNNWNHIKPNLSQGNKESIGIKEEAKKIREEGIPEPYQGIFNSEHEFEEHRKFLESYIWKFVMMLFEGSFRLISAHPMSEPKKKNSLSRNESRLSNSGQESQTDTQEADLTEQLTTFPHISRHFLILKIMLRDLFGSIVPKEDYLKKLQMGLNSIQVPDDNDNEDEIQVIDIDPIYPGMLRIIQDFLSKPILFSLLLNTTWVNNMPEVNYQSQAVNRIAVQEQESIEMLRGTVREFYEFINEALDELDNFLEGQKKACWFEVKGKDYLRDQTFRFYSEMVPEATQIGEKVIGEMKRSQIHIINAIQKTIAHLKKIPRLNLI